VNHFISIMEITSPYIYTGMIIYIILVRIIYRNRKAPKILWKVFNYL